MIKNYFSLVKFSHTVFALPFALIGFFLGVKNMNGNFEWLLLVKVLLCMISARTAAMAFNRYADRMYDAKNSRTAVREIPSGKISAAQSLLLVIISSLIFAATTYTINQVCFFLSPVALAVVLGYSLTKRFTALCHLILGIGLSLAPIGAYLAVTGKFDLLPLLFSFAVLGWVSGFDIIYALQDVEFDQSQKLFSIPAAVGKKNALMISSILHFITTSLLIIAGWQGNFSWIYFSGTVIFISLLLYQHLLVKPNDLSKVNIAFFTTNGIASLVFAVFVISELLLQHS